MKKHSLFLFSLFFISLAHSAENAQVVKEVTFCYHPLVGDKVTLHVPSNNAEQLAQEVGYLQTQLRKMNGSITVSYRFKTTAFQIAGDGKYQSLDYIFCLANVKALIASVDSQPATPAQE